MRSRPLGVLRPAAPRWSASAWLPLLACLWAFACQAGRSSVDQPGAARAAAEEVVWRARAAAVQGDHGSRRALLEQAAALDPAWVVPQRELDTLEVEAMRGPAAWARRQRMLAESTTPDGLYLLGRLEGDDGAARFARALEPKGITVSLGGEIGEVGTENSTVPELEAFMDGYNRTLAAQAAEVLAAPDLTQTCPGCAGPARVDQEGRLWCSQCEDNWG